MSSKQAHNAFYFFMLDFKTQHGRKFNSMKDVAEAAGPHWRSLPKDKREKYEERARVAKAQIRSSKLNCDNLPVDEIEEEERLEMQWKQYMKDEILASLQFDKRANALNSRLFFIIHINSFCQHEKSKEYSPSEVAIAAFSLNDGVIPDNVYHSMVHPGGLPLGYAGIAQTHATETHQIELPKPFNPEDNQSTVFAEIVDFLNAKNKGSDRFPILYAEEKNLPMVTSVIKTWCSMFGMNDRLFQIFNLQYLFKTLRNTVAGYECWSSDTKCYQEIEKDVYNYTEYIACNYHQLADALVFCSRSIVIRYAYIICDNCCGDAKIELISGYHVPTNAKISNKNDFQQVKSKKKSTTTKITSAASDSSIRDDSTTDTESVISLGKSGGWADSSSEASSFSFPELGKRGRGKNNSQYFTDGPSQETSNKMSGSSYAGATSQGTNLDFTRNPTTVFDTSGALASMTLSQETMDNEFPAIGVGRGRKPKLVQGRGRGNPFMKG